MYIYCAIVTIMSQSNNNYYNYYTHAMTIIINFYVPVKLNAPACVLIAGICIHPFILKNGATSSIRMRGYSRHFHLH